MLQSLDLIDFAKNELQIYYGDIDFKLVYNKNHFVFLKSLSKSLLN